jgi:hypothetical protein
VLQPCFVRIKGKKKYLKTKLSMWKNNSKKSGVSIQAKCTGCPGYWSKVLHCDRLNYALLCLLYKKKWALFINGIMRSRFISVIRIKRSAFHYYFLLVCSTKAYYCFFFFSINSGIHCTNVMHSFLILPCCSYRYTINFNDNDNYCHFRLNLINSHQTWVCFPWTLKMGTFCSIHVSCRKRKF